MPLACLILVATAWIAASAAIGPAVGQLPPPARLVGHMAAGTGVMVIASWLAMRLHRAATQRCRDEEAAELLDVLRMEAMRPQTVLLEIQYVQWTAQSGQRVWAVDVLTGEVSDRWIPGQSSPPDSLVLLRQPSGRSSDVIARMTPAVLKAANRHRSVEIDRGTHACHMVVEAAERLLRE